ncbi:MAG: HEAT repeat domain-containing protein [Desulfobacterales bacterium]|nr:HEAT repeat domain-containing protein [Desulfobacterales bacterium]
MYNGYDAKILEQELCRDSQGRRPCTVAWLKLFAAYLLTICLTACGAGRVYRAQPQDMVWYREDTLGWEVSEALEDCMSLGSDPKDISSCMLAKGYLPIPRTESELLEVKRLQKEGFNEEEIAAYLDWDKKRVTSYMDRGYELPRTNSLGRQSVEILTKVGRPAVENLIAELKGEDPIARRHAVRSLGEIRDPRSVGPLIVALNDADLLIQRHAVEALGKIKDPRAVEPLMAILDDENGPSHVRMAAADALGRFREPIAVQSLIFALYDENWNVRSRAAKALGTIKDPRAVEPLIRALEDEDATVRGYAAEALGKLKNVCAVEPLGAALKDTNREVRKRAAQALKKITGRDYGER